MNQTRRKQSRRTHSQLRLQCLLCQWCQECTCLGCQCLRVFHPHSLCPNSQCLVSVKWHFSCNAMKWKEKWFPNNVTRDSVMQISISVMLKRDFGGYIRVWQEYIIHCGPSFQQVKNTLYMYNIRDFIFCFRTCSFTIFVNCKSQ